MANALPENVKVCIDALTVASSDEEKITALMIAAQQVKSDECDSEARQILFKSIGSDFLERMLVGKLQISGGDDCPKDVFTQAALTIVSCFCTDPVVAKSKEFQPLIPAILQVLDGSHNNEDIKLECIHFLKSVVQDKSGQRDLLRCGGFERLVNYYVKYGTFDLLGVLTVLIQGNGEDYIDGKFEALNKLLNSVAIEFAADQSAKKFKLCSAIQNILCSCVKEAFVSSSTKEDWPKSVRKGLDDILTSRIDDSMRDSALELASTMLDYFGISWVAEAVPFRRILTRLASIEIRMQLEDRSFDEILRNADLVASCMNIIEVTAEGAEGSEAYSAAYAAVLTVLKDLSAVTNSWNQETTTFIYAMIRFLSFGYVQDILTPGDETNELIPFIINIAKDSFYSYKTWSEQNDGKSSGRKSEEPIDMSALLLPSLKKLFTIFKCRELLKCNMQFFMDCLEFHWSQSSKAGSPRVSKQGNQTSRNAVCNLLELFIASIDRQSSDSDDFSLLMKFFHQIQSEMTSNSSRLDALICILGLTLLKNQVIATNSDDPAVLGIVNNALDLVISQNSKVGDNSNNEELDAEIRMMKSELKNLAESYPELKTIIVQRLGPIGLGPDTAS